MPVLIDLPFAGPNGSTAFTDATGREWVAAGTASIQSNALAVEASGGARTSGVGLDFGFDDFDVSFDLKTGTFGGYQLWLDFLAAPAAPGKASWQVYVLSGRVYWTVTWDTGNATSIASDGAAVTDGVWHKIEFRRAGGALTLDIDGTRRGTAPDFFNYEAQSILAVGHRANIPGPTYDSTGSLRNLKIERSERVPASSGRIVSGFRKKIVGWDHFGHRADYLRSALSYGHPGLRFDTMRVSAGTRITRGVPEWFGAPGSTTQLPTFKLRGRVMQRDPDGILDDYPVKNVKVALFYRKLHLLIDVQRSNAAGYVQFDNLMPGQQEYYGIAFDSEAAPLQNSIIWDRLTPEPGP